VTEPQSEAARTRLVHARLVHGQDQPLPERVQVSAGPLTLVLEAGDVRHVHLAGREVVRRIYGAVRDHAWHTIPARLSGLTIDAGADRFACRYRAEHRQDEVAFTWSAEIDGSADGMLTFAFDGVAEATFRRNRIGLCLLHPLPALAGARARVTTSGGAIRPLHLPDLVAIPQPVDGFDDVAHLAVEVAPNLWLDAAFEGDVFQVEDQRAWIDASTKTYSTPVSRPKPVTVERGTRIRQRVTLRLVGDGRPIGAGAAPFVIDRTSGELRFGDGARGHVPRIGLPAALAQAPLRPAHVRVDLDLTDAGTRAMLPPLEAAAIPLELALHLPADGAAAERALDRVVLTGMPVARVLAFTHGHDTTQAATLDAVRAWRDRQRDHLGVPIATGTPGDLARIHVAGSFPKADAVCWAMDPQAHATDLTSIGETPAGARDQAVTVGRRYPGLPAAITATFGRHGRPDRRARSLFTAAWTLALLGALGEAGAASVTLADAADDGTPVGALGAVPLAHVLAALAVCPGAPIRPVASTLDTVYACVLETGAGQTLLLANLAPRACELALPDAGWPWTMWLLDADTPFASQTAPLGLVDPALTTVASRRVPLGPCAIARLDALV
jgi:D-apionolactonase